eukprot:PhF_6_TR19143/c0_g1_i2/m.28159
MFCADSNLRKAFSLTSLLGPLGFCFIWKWYDTTPSRKAGWQGLIAHYSITFVVTLLIGTIPNSSEQCVTKCCEVPQESTAPSDLPRCLIRSAECDVHKLCHREGCTCSFIAGYSRVIMLVVCGMAMVGLIMASWKLWSTR